MGVDPDPRKLLGAQTLINAQVKVVGDRLVAEPDGDGGANLLDQTNILDRQKILG